MAKRRKQSQRRASYDDDYYAYFPPSQPIKPTDGIQSKTKRGAFGESWWAKRWIQVLESFSIGARLQRGRSYARGGQVLNIHIEAGIVTALVQGSRPRPYQVTIQLPTLTDEEWTAVTDVMSQQAIFAAKLLAGEMPNDIEEAFKTANISLFPTKGSQLQTDCSCPDYSNPCKHIAAVYYLLGEQFDADPFLIFALRGRFKEQIINALRALRTAAMETNSTTSPDAAFEVEPAPPLAELVDAFWQVGDVEPLRTPVSAPPIPLATLRRLGASPAGTQESLAALYNEMTDYTLKKVLGTDKSE